MESNKYMFCMLVWWHAGIYTHALFNTDMFSFWMNKWKQLYQNWCWSWAPGPKVKGIQKRQRRPQQKGDKRSWWNCKSALDTSLQICLEKCCKCGLVGCILYMPRSFLHTCVFNEIFQTVFGQEKTKSHDLGSEKRKSLWLMLPLRPRDHQPPHSKESFMHTGIYDVQSQDVSDFVSLLPLL